MRTALIGAAPLHSHRLMAALALATASTYAGSIPMDGDNSGRSHLGNDGKKPRFPDEIAMRLPGGSTRYDHDLAHKPPDDDGAKTILHGSAARTVHSGGLSYGMHDKAGLPNEVASVRGFRQGAC